MASRDGIRVESNLQKLDINVKISSSKIKSELNFKHIPTAILDSVEKFYKEKNKWDKSFSAVPVPVVVVLLS